MTTANYLQNLLPTTDRLKTPYEYWEGVKPKLTHTRRFGCVAYAVTPPEKRQKLDCKARKFTFVGYAEGTKGYRLLDTETDKITISRDVMFMEGDPHQLTPWNNSKPDDKQKVMNEEVEIYTDTHTVKANDTNADIQQQGQGAFNDSSDITEPRRSARSNKGVPPDRLTMLARNEIDTEPSSWNEMKMLSKDKQRNWIKATEEETKSLNQNNTWILCDLPEGKNAIDKKWVFKLKKNPESQESQYKARLVAKGFTQKWGEDYNDTFAPVARYTTLRALLAVAASKKLQVSHYDVKTAFLNGDIDEELYMKQPEGFIKPGTEQKVCQLKKAIYGLKQSAKNWNQRIDSILKENGFQQSKADVCLYTKIDNDGPTHILVYVDDLLICGNAEKINKIAEILAQNFAIKNLGEVSLYLGIEIEKNSHGDYMFSQTEKIKQIISEFGLTDANGCNTPMLTDYLNIEEENLLPSNEQYRQAVGALLYIATTTRPDITTAVSILSRRVSTPRQCDWTAVKRVIRYLKETINLKLKLEAADDLQLIGYVDADWAGDKSDRKSSSGYLFELGNNTISWLSKKQTTVALSSTEAEYIAAALASQELLWLRQLLIDLDIPCTEATTIFEDNQGCIKLVCVGKMNARNKHIDIRHHHLRDLQTKGIMDLKYCSTDEMLADVMTKPLNRHKLIGINNRIGLAY